MFGTMITENGGLGLVCMILIAENKGVRGKMYSIFAPKIGL